MLIYLIDEDEISLYLTEQQLRMEAFAEDILTFTGAAEALAYLVPRLATSVPQVIFLDLNMPLMDGWGFLEALAPYQAALQARCHIYLLTSSLALTDTAKAQEYALVAGIIHKPLKDEEIKAILTKLQAEAAKEPGRETT
jgi:CheY-like chemotaxis protein